MGKLQKTFFVSVERLVLNVYAWNMLSSFPPPPPRPGTLPFMFLCDHPDRPTSAEPNAGKLQKNMFVSVERLVLELYVRDMQSSFPPPRPGTLPFMFLCDHWAELTSSNRTRKNSKKHFGFGTPRAFGFRRSTQANTECILASTAETPVVAYVAGGRVGVGENGLRAG